ncbi:MAG TPA: AsmA family protein [Mesorhizobium sp.]|jgi:hypothetical protein|nr:AsmA family protein [Mesorhizobium sp.]
MLARLFVAFGGLLVLALLAAVAVPPFVDWSDFRDDFERELAAVLGRNVTVRGEARATLLPFPSVTFTDVAVGGVDGGAEPVMTVATFSMDAELAPLLSGEFRIFDMRLERPRAMVALDADGKVDWAIRPSSPFDPRRITLEKLTITDGEVTLKHGQSGRTHRISEIDADLSARSLAGPWRANGTLRFDDIKATVTLTTGVAEGDSMGVRLAVEPAGLGVTLAAEGGARLDNGAPSWAGTFRITSAAPPASEAEGQGAQAQKADRVAQNQGGPGGFRVAGAFELDGEGIEAKEFRFETGPVDDPYAATGRAMLDWGGAPRFAVEASGAQVRFDEAVLGVEAEEGAAEGLTLERRLAALEDAVRALPRPAITGTISFDLPAVVAGDTTVRDLALDAQPAPDGWRIDRLVATLPGRATLEASGLLGLDQALSFDGSLLLAVSQPSGFAAWLARDVDEAIRRLPAAGFSADVTLTAERQSFRKLELNLGGATFRGVVENQEPEGGRASATVSLDGGRLDLDQLAAFASIFVNDEGRSRFAERDLDLKLSAGPVGAAGVSVETMGADLRLREERLDIRKLDLGDLAGANLSVSGVLNGFSPLPRGELFARLEAGDLAPLVELAAAKLPGLEPLGHLNRQAKAFPGLLADAAFDVVLKSPDAAGTSLTVEGLAGGGRIDADVSATGDLRAPVDAEWAVRFEAANPDGAALLALMGPPALPLDLLGPAQANLSFSGSPGRGMIGQASLAGEGFALSLDGVLSAGPDGTAANGAAKLEADDIEPWMMTVGAGLPGFGLGTSVEVAAEVDWADGLLVLSGLTGSVGQDAVAGDVNVSVDGGKPDVTGALSLDTFQLEPFAAALLGPDALATEGEAWPQAPFSETPALPFSASLDLSVGRLDVGGLAFDDAAFAFKLDGERLALDGLTAAAGGGAIEGSAELRNSAGTGLLSMQGRLRGGDLATLLPANGLNGKTDLSAALSASGKSVAGLAAALSGSGTATVTGLRVEGLNGEALPQLIAAAEAIGREIDAKATASFAPSIAGAGRFTAARVDVPFTVAGGVLRTPPLVIASPAATLSAEIRADASTGNVTVDGAIAYAAGDEALVGSEPRVAFRREGPLDGGRFVFNTEPLAQFLTQRALEREQARVEAMQADLLEKQRLRRETRYYAALQTQREDEERRETQAAAREAEQRRLEENARRAEEARRREEAERRPAAAAVPSAPTEPVPTPPPSPAADPPVGLESLPGVTLQEIPAQQAF